MTAEITLNKLRKTRIGELFDNLVTNSTLTNEQIQALYKLAIIFLNKGDERVKEFGYKILLKTSFLIDSVKPIFDISVCLGYYPISKYIDTHLVNNHTDHFVNIFTSAFFENYRRKNIYLTEQQTSMINEYEQHPEKTMAVVAPTSYGKSDLIISTINNNKECNICIIVPTKALLSQTKKRILKNEEFSYNRKIITHPDMYQSTDSNFIAVLTQERLLRLLENVGNLIFNIAIIDEAHNIFNDDSRNRLLAATIAILFFRNNNIAFKFLSPFLIDINNLKVISSNYSIIENRITEHLKVNNYYCIDLLDDGILKYYDQFLNRFITVSNNTYSSVYHFIKEKAGSKNIIYVNSPPKLEAIAKNISATNVECISTSILKACQEIANYLHEDYDLINCLKHGVVYHHGSVPDIVKLYIEALYADEPELNFIICSSTLLEGVNIPAEKLFVLDSYKGRGNLTPAQFKNLAGRVCRFSELFSQKNNNLKLLEPDIYIVKSDFMRSNANIKKFIEFSVKADNVISDKLNNVLLSNTTMTDNNKLEQLKEVDFISNFEPGLLLAVKHNKATTDIGKICFKNNIKEIDIIANEIEMQKKVDTLLGTTLKATSSRMVLDLIAHIFLDFVIDNDKNHNLLRLKNIATRSFYSMFLDWIMRSAPYSELIGRFMSYWDKLIQTEPEPLAFVGRWGDETRGGHSPLWVNLKDKKPAQRLNLAIIRIKEEQDFVENTIIKFIEILNDLLLIDDEIYKKVKYGTSDELTIMMIKNGYSNSLAHLLLKKYRKYLRFDFDKNIVISIPEVITEMKNNNENDIFIFEAGYNVKTIEMKI